MSETLGILHYPWGPDYGLEAMPPRSLRRAYRRALAYKANPRDPAYMEALFRKAYPGATLVSSEDEAWADRAAAAERTVLLYPDATGLGFGPLERRLLASGARAPEVLNGRRRAFVLDGSRRRALRLRRLLERSMLGEAVALGLLALATVPLVLVDLISGRR